MLRNCLEVPIGHKTTNIRFIVDTFYGCHTFINDTFITDHLYINSVTWGIKRF